MPNFIDRRLNPKNKSLNNRERFLKRVRGELKQIVNKQVSGEKISEVDSDHFVPVPVKGTAEPRFTGSDETGRRNIVLPGNRDFSTGDRLPKHGRRANASGTGGIGEDDFRFVLSREEFLDLFFEDLALPDLVKLNLKDVTTFRPHRAGYAMTGSPTNINVGRTMRNSYGRRIALKRPRQAEVEAIADELAALAENKHQASAAIAERMALLRIELERLERRRRLISYVDPVDIRYNRFEAQPLPNAKAVMFCLMDVSGSMGEREKDLAKRFFILLHLFLKRRYERTDIVFIRHTHEAKEVGENTFFHSTESGGTVVSSALEEMRRIVETRYPVRDWNIYAAQASDGDNFEDDSQNCVLLLNGEIMRLCQYYAYVEIIDEREREIFMNTDNGTSLWNAYRLVRDKWANFQMTRIASPADIYPVFRELFARQSSAEKR
jgi:uncharacterized sporulation protein YeaH/YhbH (DUF444 family)